MAGRGRFKIPSENELGNNKPDVVKPMSVFSNYKLNKNSEVSDKEKREKNTGTTGLSSSSTAKIDQPPSALPTHKSTLPATTAVGNSSIVSVGKPTSAGKPTSVTSTESTATLASDQVPTTAPVAAGSKAGSGNSIIVNFRQRGNPILKHIRNVPWEYGSIVPDYVMGKANCALFLSLKYHQLHPAYLHNRLKELGKGYDLRVLLAQVDVADPHHILKDLAKICILADLTLILAFTPEEAGRYLDSYKVYENKPAEALMERTDTDFMSKVNDCLTTVKAVNKTDCMTLISSFKSMEGIVNSSKEDLSICAGFGPHKAQRLYNVLHESFVKGRKRRLESPTKAVNTNETSPKKETRMTSLVTVLDFNALSKLTAYNATWRTEMKIFDSLNPALHRNSF